MATVHRPEVLWAQRSSETDETKNVLYLTINLPDIVPETVEYNLTPTSISFKATAGSVEKREYSFDLNFYSDVVPEASKKSQTSRSILLVIRKKEQKAAYWPRLMKVKGKTPYIKTDFSKWADEDDQDDETAKVDDSDMSAMGGMPGMGGMGGMPGMGGMGGMPGMGGMGGMPGMGGMGGGMDLEAMMKSMGAAGGGAGDFGGDGPSGADVESDDSDDDGPPPLEDAEPHA